MKFTPRYRSYWPYYLAALTSVLFLLVLSNVRVEGRLQALDQAIYLQLQQWRTAELDHILITITQLGDTFMVTTISSVVLLWLLFRKYQRAAIYWSLALIGAAIINTGIKAAIARVRPGDMMYTGWTNFSFPSGHTTSNLVLYGLVCILLFKTVRGLPRVGMIVLLIGFALLVAFSRLYLGAHWFSDVLGGMLVATSILSIVGARYHAGKLPTIAPVQILIPVIATMLIVGTYHAYDDRHVDRDRYTSRVGSQAGAAAPD